MKENKSTTVVVVQSEKSMALSIILTFFFGPLGMLYSTITGGIIMMILSLIVGILTLGFGLFITWPIQLIWSCIAVSSHNRGLKAECHQTIVNNTPTEIKAAINNETKDDERSTSVHKTKSNELRYYSEANKLTDSKVDNLLSNIEDLNEEFVEALRFVQKERILRNELISDRKNAFYKAIKYDEIERINRISSSSLYSTISISALRYIQRCVECEIEPTETGFLSTFTEGYVAPETPAERAKREREFKKLQDLNAARRARDKKQWIIFSILLVIVSILFVYFMVIKPNNEYKNVIERVDMQYIYLDKTSSLENQESKLKKLMQLYCDIKIPLIGKTEKSEYVSLKISSIKAQLEILEAEQNKLKEEARKKAEVARKAEAAQKAAKQAEYKRLNPTNAAAQCDLGYAYEKGNGVIQSYTEAVKWYRKAAEQGNTIAQCNLGICYANGRGVDKSYVEAAKWYRKAADKGNTSAQNNLGTLYKSGHGVAQSYTEAVKWYRKAILNVYAQNNLGTLYRDGLGVKKNYSEAVRFYRKAAEQGFAPAQNNLGDCYKNGQSLYVKRDEAIKWYRKAAEQGNIAAKNSLKELGEV